MLRSSPGGLGGTLKKPKGQELGRGAETVGIPKAKQKNPARIDPSWDNTFFPREGSRKKLFPRGP